jgi:uncharacterized damage-inducible protein DinB
MASSTTLGALYEHNLWTNQLMLEACSKLTDEQLDATTIGTYGSIRDTLVHLVGAEERYVTMLTGQPPIPVLREHEPFPGFEELIKASKASGQSLIDIANSAVAGDMLRGKRRNGESYEIVNTVVLTQAINHATEHRVHINSVLTHLGLEPLDLDGWAYGDAHGQISQGEPSGATAS